MPEVVKTREIEIDWAGKVARDLADFVKDGTEERDHFPIQSLHGNLEDGMKATIDVYPPHEVLARAKQSLIEQGHDDIPSDPDAFSVMAVDVETDDHSTVTIRVFE